MKNIDSNIHVRGESIYVDDIPTRRDTLFATVFYSSHAHAKINHLDCTEALKSQGVVAVYTYKDIPGVNQIGGIIEDETLLAEHEVDFIGQPIVIVVADSERHARMARKKIKMDLAPLKVIVDPREAHALEQYIVAPRTFAQGDVQSGFAKAATIVEGRADMGGQEHTYLETQGSYCHPMENGHMKVYSSTQSPTHTQKIVSKILGVPMHQVEVDVTRLGGGFGGKEDQATAWAACAALAAQTLKRPVKMILSRHDDFTMTGKRHPYSFDFKIGVTSDYKISAYDVVCYQNAGAAADLSPAIMERTLFHGSGSYSLPNAKVTVYSCKTNLPPNTAFRGFGAPQAMFVLESAIFKAAAQMGVDPSVIQEANLLSEGSTFPYGQIAERCQARPCWETLKKNGEVANLYREAQEFNKTNTFKKKGVAQFPLCFGISFTKTFLNQAGSLVHIYTDGSVAINSGVIEMGQAVNTKLVQVAMTTLGISASRVRVSSTNTSRVANTSPTAASSGADLNGKATQKACQTLLTRLLGVAAKELKTDVSTLSIQNEKVCVNGKASSIDWNRLIQMTYESRVDLSEHGYYATPDIFFDKSKEKGHPFAYHVYGTAAIGVTVDCIRGTYEIDTAKIVHDFGTSMNLDIDLGQVEGALAQGIGLMTIEELYFNADGKFVYDSLASYKVPDIYFAPKHVDIRPLDGPPAPLALLGSKAVGEPPLCYGIGTYFAILKAMNAFNPKVGVVLSAPMTHQKTMENLYRDFSA